MQYVCRVGTPDGRVLEELHNAADEIALRNELDKLGYHIFDVQRKGGLPRRMAVPAIFRSGRRRKDLSDAFASYGEMSPRLYPSALKAGERSGELEQVIRRFIRYLKLVLEARRRVITALVYPAVLICLSITMISVMMVYVVPKITVFFENLEVELPLMTRMLIAVSGFAHRNVVWLALGVLGGVVAFRAWRRTEPGRLWLDRAKLKLPFIAPGLHRFALPELCRSLATLLSGGIPLVPALEIATDAVGNVQVRQAIAPQIQLVREGKPFHEALERSGVFLEMSIDMIKVGEATGSLDEMLTSVADFMDEQIETRMGRILALIEPLMLVFMGIIVAMILVAIYLPLVSALGQSQY